MHMSAPSSRVTNKHSKILAWSMRYYWSPLWLTLHSWRWRHVSQTFLLTSTKLHGVTSQNTELLMMTVEWTSNPTIYENLIMSFLFYDIEWGLNAVIDEGVIIGKRRSWHSSPGNASCICTRLQPFDWGFSSGLLSKPTTPIFPL